MADVTQIRPPEAVTGPAPPPRPSKRDQRARAIGAANAALVDGASIVLIAPARFVTFELAEFCTGYSAAAMRSKKQRSEWVEGREYVIAPDGRTLVDLQGYERWAQRGKK